MVNKIFSKLHWNWKDASATIVVVALIVISIMVQYNLGMLIGFLILFIFLSFDRIKQIVFDMNVKKIFGIEFGEFREKLREEVERHGIRLSDDEIDVVSEAALNQISGVAYKGRYYEEMVYYALQDLNLNFIRNISAIVDKNRLDIDFVIELGYQGRVLGVEAAYSGRRYLPKDKIDRIINNFTLFKQVDNLSHFVIITNTEVREEDRKRLQALTLPIDIIENIVSPDGILSRIQDYLINIDKNRKGSLES